MKLTKEDIAIVTVSASGTKRQLINTSLRSRGYTEVSGAPDMKTVIDLMATSKINWLICPLGSGEPVNALQIMDYVTKNPKECDMLVSLVINEDDVVHLGKAFELGLLSFHIGLEAKDHVENAFNELFELFDQYEGKQDLVATVYLRRFLKENKRLPDLARFEKRLLKTNPGRAELLNSMAESYYLTGQHQEASALWGQALAVDPSLTELVETTQSACGFQDDDSEGSGEKLNVLGIDRCIVIDPDKKDLEIIDGFLNELGVPDIKLLEIDSI